ncbi:MAG: hypothetical protein KJO69_06705 [Gammaproteobacteria bacterium]|nr:hypothetical protein [Gammaproteobacteria bacterium]
MAQYKVDIFKVLEHISNGDMSFFDDLTESQLKSVSPIVLQMWVMGANNNLDGRVVMTDEFVNQYAFTLGKHNKLLLKLMCVANNFGTYTRYKFTKPKASRDSFLISLTKQYYNLSDEHASQDYRILTKEDFESMGSELGLEADEAKKLKNAIIQRFR